MSEFLAEGPAQLPPKRWARMGLSVSEYHEVKAKKLALEARAPSVGDMAPDFEVEQLSPDRSRTREMSRFSATRSRPVGLTCGAIRDRHFGQTPRA